jgi:hypothetical protein
VQWKESKNIVFTSGDGKNHEWRRPRVVFGVPTRNKHSNIITRAFRTSESADFFEVRVRKVRTLKTLRTRTQRVCLFTHLYCKEVNISQKNSEISIFSFLNSYYFLYKPYAQISTIVKKRHKHFID